MSEELSPAVRFTRQELFRRGLLTGAAVGIAPELLASLGSGTAAAAPLAADAGTIDFYSWQGYDLLQVPALKAWRTKNGVTIHSTYCSTHNDITAKFTGGGGKGI